MAITNYTPELHSVFNELDRIGLLLGLPRLEEERNADYRQRLFDVLVHRAGSTYKGLIYGVTRELGLDLFCPFTIRPILTSNGSTVATQPAIVFSETKCYVYEDYSEGEDGLTLTIDRLNQIDNGYTMHQLTSLIEGTGYFECLYTPNQSRAQRSMTIFNQSTISIVTAEDLDLGGPRIKLKNNNLIDGSVTVRSSVLDQRVSSLVQMRVPGQYYIDLSAGILYSTRAPEPGAVIRYRYRNDNYKVIASPVIIHNLQSTDFRSKMFDQETLNGETTDGAPTPYGLDLINELLSVYPLGWGP